MPACIKVSIIFPLEAIIIREDIQWNSLPGLRDDALAWFGESTSIAMHNGPFELQSMGFEHTTSTRNPTV